MAVEVIQNFQHIVRCDVCGVVMEEINAVENRKEELEQRYTKPEAGPLKACVRCDECESSFSAAVQTCVKRALDKTQFVDLEPLPAKLVKG